MLSSHDISSLSVPLSFIIKIWKALEECSSFGGNQDGGFKCLQEEEVRFSRYAVARNRDVRE